MFPQELNEPAEIVAWRTLAVHSNAHNGFRLRSEAGLDAIALGLGDQLPYLRCMSARSTSLKQARPTELAVVEGGTRAVTSYDVAREAGVSQSAVSRCFTPGASVSKVTRAKIMRAVDKLGYRPNAIARSLITQRSGMVAVIVANMGFNPEFTAQLSRTFSARGLHILLFTLDHESEADHVIDQIWQYRVDGVIAAVRLPRRHVEAFAKRRLPAIFVNRLDDDVHANTVCCDQASGERMLVDRLIAAGHQSFGVIRGPVDSAVSVRRVENAVAQLQRHAVDHVLFADGDFDHASGRAAFPALLLDGKAPDAVICANDMMALGAMDAARHDFGLRVPEDVSIVGFDGAPQSRWPSYDLVTVRQPTRAMVEAAADMLIARVEDPGLAIEKRSFTGEFLTGTSARLD